MKRLVHNEASIKDNPVINGRQEHRVTVTHLLNDLTPQQVKCKIFGTLADEKGRLEIKDGTAILCFLNLQDREDFLVNLQKDINHSKSLVEIGPGLAITLY